MKLKIEGGQSNLDHDDDSAVQCIHYRKIDLDSLTGSFYQVDIDDKRGLVKITRKNSAKQCKRCCCYCILILLCTLAIISLCVTSFIAYYLPSFLTQRLLGTENTHASSTEYTNFTQLNTLARNFYLQKDGSTTSTQQDVGDQWPSLGLWHILPKSVSAELQAHNMTTANDMVRSLNEGNETILIFFHGSNANRIVHKKFYNGMAGLDLHVLVADYRGFADSTGNPTETGLYEDAHTIFNYVRITAPNKGIVLFGQSLGSGVATRLAADLSKTGMRLKGLILTAAFNNWNDEVSYLLKSTYSFTNYTPFFDEILRGANTRAGLELPTDRNIKSVNCPILIVSAKNDPIVPVKLVKRLVAAGNVTNRTITYVELQGKTVEHRVHMAEEIPEIVRTFVND